MEQLEVEREIKSKENFVYTTKYHRLSIKKDDWNDWYGELKESPTSDIYKNFLLIIQKNLKPMKIDEVITGNIYLNSFNSIANKILEEIDVDGVLIGYDKIEIKRASSSGEVEE